MTQYNLGQYIDLSIHFNQMSFFSKIELIKNNSDILTLASDGNWWGVKIKDKNIWEKFEEKYQFQIKNEWGSDEMCTLVFLLGIDNTDI